MNIVLTTTEHEEVYQSSNGLFTVSQSTRANWKQSLIGWKANKLNFVLWFTVKSPVGTDAFRYPFWQDVYGFYYHFSLIIDQNMHIKKSPKQNKHQNFSQPRSGRFSRCVSHLHTIFNQPCAYSRERNARCWCRTTLSTSTHKIW